MNFSQLYQTETPLPLLIMTSLFILLSPAVWNVLGVMEYKTKMISKMVNGDKFKGCKILGYTIQTVSRTRDLLIFLTGLYSMNSESMPGMGG